MTHRRAVSLHRQAPTGERHGIGVLGDHFPEEPGPRAQDLEVPGTGLETKAGKGGNQQVCQCHRRAVLDVAARTPQGLEVEHRSISGIVFTARAHDSTASTRPATTRRVWTRSMKPAGK